jgi:purine-cytosine permease-like protein
MKRTKLFQMQGILAVLLIVITALQIALDSAPGDFLKAAIAPFGAISLLLFALFVHHRRSEKLDDEETYRFPTILANVGLAVVAGAVVVFLTSLLADLSQTLDRVIFCFSILVAVVLYIYEKRRDFRSMGLLTGIGEGVVILLIFFR